mgnify:CR=1 FL=1
MPPSQLEIIGHSSRLDSLPLEVSQKFSSSAAVTRLLLLLPALLLVLVPTASLVMGSSPAWAYAAAHPGEATLAASGVTAFLVLFGLPFARAARNLGSERCIRIDAATVTVHDRTIWGSMTWRLPLSSFLGIAHVVRTNLSGTRHEIVLVHPVRARTILIGTAERISEADMAAVAQLLDLPQLPARDLLRWRNQVEEPVRPAAGVPLARAA